MSVLDVMYTLLQRRPDYTAMNRLLLDPGTGFALLNLDYGLQGLPSPQYISYDVPGPGRWLTTQATLRTAMARSARGYLHNAVPKTQRTHAKTEELRDGPSRGSALEGARTQPLRDGESPPRGTHPHQVAHPPVL